MNRREMEKQNRRLIDRYMFERHDAEFLRYLIDEIYGEDVGICDWCEKGLVFEVVEGDYSYGQCDNCWHRYPFKTRRYYR